MTARDSLFRFASFAVLAVGVALCIAAVAAILRADGRTAAAERQRAEAVAAARAELAAAGGRLARLTDRHRAEADSLARVAGDAESRAAAALARSRDAEAAVSVLAPEVRRLAEIVRRSPSRPATSSPSTAGVTAGVTADTVGGACTALAGACAQLADSADVAIASLRLALDERGRALDACRASAERYRLALGAERTRAQLAEGASAVAPAPPGVSADTSPTRAPSLYVGLLSARPSWPGVPYVVPPPGVSAFAAVPLAPRLPVVGRLPRLLVTGQVGACTAVGVGIGL